MPTNDESALNMALEEKKWFCPIAECRHEMRFDSAGKRAHMRTRHKALCNMPCPRGQQCQHGCIQCVPHCVLKEGLHWSSSSSSSNASAPSQAQVTPIKAATSGQKRKSESSGGKSSKEPRRIPENSSQDAPKRPKSGYMIYSSEIFAEVLERVKAEGGGFGDCGKMISERWTALSEAQKASYRETSEKQKIEYDREFAKYKERQGLLKCKQPPIHANSLEDTEHTTDSPENSTAEALELPKAVPKAKPLKQKLSSVKPKAGKKKAGRKGKLKVRRKNKAASSAGTGKTVQAGEQEEPKMVQIRATGSFSHPSFPDADIDIVVVTERNKQGVWADHGTWTADGVTEDMHIKWDGKKVQMRDSNTEFRGEMVSDGVLEGVVIQAGTQDGAPDGAFHLTVNEASPLLKALPKGMPSKRKSSSEKEVVKSSTSKVQKRPDRVISKISKKMVSKGKFAARVGKAKSTLSTALEDLLPPDAPPGHKAHAKCRTLLKKDKKGHPRCDVSFMYTKQGVRAPFVMIAYRFPSTDVALRVLRHVYVKTHDEGWSTEEMNAFRKSMYIKMKPYSRSPDDDTVSDIAKPPLDVANGNRPVDQLKAGDKVKLHSLKMEPRLNGSIGKCIKLLESGRWEVILEDTEKVNVRPQNLEIIHAPCEKPDGMVEDVTTLGAQELLSLLKCPNSDTGSVLRGVGRGLQEEILQLLNDGETNPVSDEPSSTLVVPIAASAPQISERCLEPLQRKGPEGGFGPDDEFSFGVVVGPSGSGVSTVLHKLARDLDLPSAPPARFKSDESVASCFSDAVSMLPRVGLNSIPAWMRPYQILSNGQQQRVRLGLGLADGCVVDDFGSGIDEQEIDSIAHAIGKFIRQKKLSRVLLGTHFLGAVRYLQPDFVIFSTGQWSVNPNPYSDRAVTVQIEPGFLGVLQDTVKEEEQSADDTAYVHEVRGSDSHSMRVSRHVLEIKVKTDEKTIDAANAFELDFDGTARCAIPVLPRSELPVGWSIGLIVGPSGTGKTKTIKTFQRDAGGHQHEVKYDATIWPLSPEDDVLFRHVEASCGEHASNVLNACCVPEECWTQFPVTLSRSEAWRAQIACQIAVALPKQDQDAADRTIIVDEFTTQLDRHWARTLCLSLSKYSRSVGIRLLCATVHRDIIAWLDPSWVFDTEYGTLNFCNPEVVRPATSQLETDLKYTSPDDIEIWKPPTLIFEVRNIADSSTIPLWNDKFHQHHYLTGVLRMSLYGGNFVAIERSSGRLAGFHASAMLPGAKTYVREYRLVILPEWQGFGIGPRLSNFIAERMIKHFKDKGYGYISKTAHPRLGEMRQHDPRWSPASSNLEASNKVLGDIGDFGNKAGRVKKTHWLLPHGTKVSTTTLKDAFPIRVTECAIPDKEVELNVARHKEDLLQFDSLENACGIFLEADKLVVERFEPPIAEYFRSAPPGFKWKILNANGNAVLDLEGLRTVLREATCVVTLTFRAVRSSDSKRSGPSRSSSQDMEDDLTWLRKRFVAQASLADEERHLYELLNSLKMSAKEHRKCAEVRRPQIPEVWLDAWQPLVDAINQRQQVKQRITYSHSYVGDSKERFEKFCTKADNYKYYNYQHWMKVRIPEFRESGRTHQAAIEAAMAEFGGQTPMRVHQFDWAELSADLEESSSPKRCLGLELDDDARALDCQPGSEFLRGFNYANYKVAVNLARIVAVRRGRCKVEVASVSDLSEALMRLSHVEGATGLLYVKSDQKRKGRSSTASSCSVAPVQVEEVAAEVKSSSENEQQWLEAFEDADEVESPDPAFEDPYEVELPDDDVVKMDDGLLADDNVE